MQPTRTNNFTPAADILAISLELATRAWKLALHDGKREQPTLKTVAAEEPAQRLDEVLQEIERIKVKWELAPGVRTVVVYEAGQDGFWIHRALTERGIEAHICDPASIPVERKQRRAKTDRLDAIRLVVCLRAWLNGELDRMHMIRIPSQEEEDQRHLVRDRGQLQKEIGQHRDRIRKLLRTEGCWRGGQGDIDGALSKGELRRYDGSALPGFLVARLRRECERLAQVQRQFDALEQSLLAELPVPTQQRVVELQRLKGVGPVGAERLTLELFWRRFDNGKQVGACVGLVPQPYDSGESRVDQGISKQGNRRVRALLVEMSWLWLRYQPDSAITRWFNERTRGSAKNKRARRIAIVAVARRLVIALWHYTEHGVMPAGAALKQGVKAA